MGEMEKHKGGRPSKNRLHDATSLEELGIEEDAIPPLAMHRLRRAS